MAQQTLNNGETGLVIRTKINDQFTELYGLAVTTITGATSLDAGDLGATHVLTGTSADYTVDLPTAVGNSGTSIAFKGSSALTKVVTIAGSSGQTIDGEASRKISTSGLIILMSDGSNWIVMNEVGSWIPYTPVLAGFSADPTFTRTDYFRVGKLCTLRIISLASGTSNATTKTITAPFNAAEVCHGICQIVINNTTVATTPGLCATTASSNVINVYRNNDVGTTAWTASGGCRYNLNLTYRIA